MNNKKALVNESIKKSYTYIIPKTIQELKCFICYDENKTPINPETGFSTTSAIQNRWGYQTALQAVEKHQNIKGTGIILGITSIGNLCGLDIDNCVNESGEIAPEAMEIINQLDTYAELSPSKKGIHCVFIAKKSGSVCKNSDLNWCKCLELYDHNRYFTFTGDSINNKPIEHRQAECDRIYKNFFEIKENPKSEYMSIPVTSSDFEKDEKKLLKGLCQNGKLKDIYEGIRPKTDESSNDLIFCNLLKIWSNRNKALMKKTFINSDYFRSKDDEHKKKILERPDYLDRTISRALDERGQDGQL